MPKYQALTGFWGADCKQKWGKMQVFSLANITHYKDKASHSTQNKATEALSVRGQITHGQTALMPLTNATQAKLQGQWRF